MHKTSTAHLPKPGYYTGLPDSCFSPAKSNGKSSAPCNLTLSHAQMELLGMAPPIHQIGLKPYAKLKVQVERAPSSMAAMTPEWSRQVVLTQDRQRLHENSLNMVSKWGNTIAGQRKARLAAQEEKSRLAEDERKRIDAEWEQVKQAERNAMVKRAKEMQYLQDSRIRELNSQATVTQVLKERSAQIKYKAMEEEKIRVKSRERHDHETAQLIQADLIAQERLEQAKAAKLAIAAANVQMAQEKHHERELEQNDLKTWFKLASEDGARQVKDQEDNRAALKAQEALAVTQALDRIVYNKHASMRYRQEQDEKEMQINSEIKSVKDGIAKRRKDTESLIIKSRIQRNEIVASRYAPILEAFEQERNVYLTKIEHAHEGEQELRLKKEAEVRKRATEEYLLSLDQSCKNHKNQQLQTRHEAAEMRKHNEKIARDALHSAGTRLVRFVDTCKDFGDLYRKEMHDHQEQILKQKELANQNIKKDHDRIAQDDADSRLYVKQLVSNLKQMGNDASLVEKKFAEMEMDPRSKNKFTDREVNTFQRLGFN